jgi:hypothetical protein
MQANEGGLGREREKRTSIMEIANAEQVIAVQKAERKCEREWSVILQKQLGDEQTRGAQMQLQCNRAERAYKLREVDLQRLLGVEHAARMEEQNEHKVGFLFCCLSFLYL